MSITSAEPDQHHGTRLITTCSSLTVFTDLPGMGNDSVGRLVPSQVLSDHTRLSAVKDMGRLQPGETTYSRQKNSKYQQSRLGIGDAKHGLTLNGM